MSRKYKLCDMTINVKNDKDCIFCKYCNFIWDYTNGPYMFLCDRGRSECSEAKTSEEHTCKLFEEKKLTKKDDHL